MDKIDTQSLMLQMRALTAEAQNKPLAVTATEQTGQSSAQGFADLLKQSVEGVNNQQHKAREMRESFERGDEGADLTEVMLQAQKASLSFQAMTQVRNKLVEAYKDVMNMPI
ncbi:flagellar hook-basal body complex protein FliE [Thiomicrospira microaerophila]|uniref:flagellar hook-basal body complex protein FliE n=1 Tax=Thiomicrospira microaerophila TaxID=406020 RepID=UPI00200C84FB|nr:flagellar hook-basal body complex protein FliE [Thiomicrospira microaerophila]UQB41688.1 flagellar hook-basal body complex protein FliE [Thiomicrospira microaerophila]